LDRGLLMLGPSRRRRIEHGDEAIHIGGGGGDAIFAVLVVEIGKAGIERRRKSGIRGGKEADRGLAETSGGAIRGGIAAGVSRFGGIRKAEGIVGGFFVVVVERIGQEEEIMIMAVAMVLMMKKKMLVRMMMMMMMMKKLIGSGKGYGGDGKPLVAARERIRGVDVDVAVGAERGGIGLASHGGWSGLADLANQHALVPRRQSIRPVDPLVATRAQVRRIRPAEHHRLAHLARIALLARHRRLRSIPIMRSIDASDIRL
jgi:hypothetical protein